MMRLSIDVTDEQHQYLKAAAAIQGKSIKNYVLERALPNDEEQKALDALELLLASRMTSANAGDFSGKDLDTIFEEEEEAKAE